jgi:hypothetical protein
MLLVKNTREESDARSVYFIPTKNGRELLELGCAYERLRIELIMI